MSIWEILLIGAALSMDAVAVGMANGIADPKMRLCKMLAIAGMYALFQFVMPVIGYYGSSFFSEFVEKIAPWLSFALLGILGGKMIFDGVREWISRKRAQGQQEEIKPQKKLGFLTLTAQAVATSIDALAVGITFLAVDTTEGLPVHAVFCALAIGAITFAFSFAAVGIGKKAGDKFSDKAGIFGGCVLLAIGIKILVEGLI